MGIREQIELVNREFVSCAFVLMAVAQHEKVPLFQAASWFLRNEEKFRELQVVQLDRKRNDFSIDDFSAVELLFSSVKYGDDIPQFWFDCEGEDDSGWLSGELKQVFSFCTIDYPEAEIEKLQSTNLSANALPFANANAALTAVAQTDQDIDPVDLPLELDAANMAYRAVLNGYGDKTDTFKNRLIAYLQTTYTDLKPEAVQRIATVANPDKATGRKKLNKE